MKTMHKWVALLILAACTAWQPAYAQQGYDIGVTVRSFPGKELYLAYYFGDKQYLKDTATAENGVFRFQGTEALPGGMYLVVMPPKNNYFEIVVSGDQQFTLETDTLDFVKSMKVKGSEENDLFFQDLRYLAAKRAEITALNEQGKSLAPGSPEAAASKEAAGRIDQEVKTYRKEFIARHPDLFYTKVLTSMQEPEIPEPPKDASGKVLDSLFQFKYYRAHYFDHLDFADDRMLRTPIMYNKVSTFLERLTHPHPDSLCKAIDYIAAKSRANDEVYQFFVSNLLNKYANSKIMGHDAVYVCMVERYYMNGQAWWADSALVAKMTEEAYRRSPTLLGRPAPNFRAQDPSGAYQSVNGVQAEYLALYFWDYDCGHCKTITPKLAEAFKQYQGKNVKLIAVSINGDVEVWKKKIAEYGLDQPHIINVQDHARRSGFDGMYDIRSTPRLFLLDKEKKIMAKQIDPDQLQEILNPKLGLPVPEKKAGSGEETEEE